MRYDVADFTKVIDIVYIIILHAVEKNFCNLPSSFNCVDTCYLPLLLLSKEAKLKFHFKHPSVTSCTLPGKCGFILKTVPSEAALWTLRLCTEKEDYNNESVHFHDEVQAENMHLYFYRIHNGDTDLYPISWLGWFHSKDAVDKRNKWETDWGQGNNSSFKVLYKI